MLFLCMRVFVMKYFTGTKRGTLLKPESFADY